MFVSVSVCSCVCVFPFELVLIASIRKSPNDFCNNSIASTFPGDQGNLQLSISQRSQINSQRKGIKTYPAAARARDPQNELAAVSKTLSLHQSQSLSPHYFTKCYYKYTKGTIKTANRQLTNWLQTGAQQYSGRESG